MLFDILLRYQEPEEHFIVLEVLPPKHTEQNRNAPCSRLPLLPRYEQFHHLCVAAPFAIAGLSMVPNRFLKPLHFASPGTCASPFATCDLRAGGAGMERCERMESVGRGMEGGMNSRRVWEGSELWPQV